MSDDWYLIEGINPEPWKAAEGSIGKRAGKPFILFRTPEGSKAFKEAVKSQFEERYPDVPKYLSDVRVTFYLWRTVDSYESMAGHHASANYADATNMQKLLEDALQGILYDNDKNNRDVRTRIMMQEPNIEPRILIMISGDWFDHNERDQVTRVADALHQEPKEAPSNILPPERAGGF